MSRRLALPLILLLALAVGACTESAAEESPSRAPTSGAARGGDATGPARLTKALAAIEDLQKDPDHRSSSGRETRESLRINSLSAACPQESAEIR
jgi:hypothetical protein